MTHFGGSTTEAVWLVALIFDHYEQFDSRHMGMLSSRRIYVPQMLEAD